MEWPHIIHSCTRCGASWHAPREEPHRCIHDKAEFAAYCLSAKDDKGKPKAVRSDTALQVLRKVVEPKHYPTETSEQ
jgi:hypothetical protein